MRRSQRALLTFIFITIITALTASPPPAQAAVMFVEDLPAPQLVGQDRETLLGQGCVERLLGVNGRSVEVPDGAWQHIAARDWVVGRYMFCPDPVIANLTIQEGEVLIVHDFLLAPLRAIRDAVDRVATAIFNFFKQVMFTVFSWLLLIPVNIALLIIKLVSLAVGVLLTASSFTDHSFVRAGHPTVLNLVNLGFIIALLIIAIMILFRREGYSLRRTLPRLIIAALLVNFSLVIAGLLIDVSRLLMAGLVAGSGVALTQINDLGIVLLNNSVPFTRVFGNIPAPEGGGAVPLVSLQPAYRWINDLTEFLQVLIAAAIIFIFLVGLIVAAVGLLIRYIMLVLLLIISPFAYLFMALPNTANLAQGWWNNFLKYVFYGPIALFILILLTSVPDVGGASETGTILNVAVACGLLVFGMTSALRLSGFASNIALGGMKRAGQAAMRHPRLAGTALGAATLGPLGLVGGALAGYGAGAVGRRGALAGRDFGREYSTRSRERARRQPPRQGALARTLLGPRRDAEGNLVRGETSAGAGLARVLTGGREETRRRTEEAQRARRAYEDPTGDVTRAPELAPSQLRKAHVLQGLGESSLPVLDVAQRGTQAQLMAIAGNIDYLRNMNSADRDQFVLRFQTVVNNRPTTGPGGLSDSDKSRVIDGMLRSLDQVNNPPATA